MFFLLCRKKTLASELLVMLGTIKNPEPDFSGSGF